MGFTDQDTNEIYKKKFVCLTQTSDSNRRKGE